MKKKATKAAAVKAGAPMNRAIKTGIDEAQASQMMTLEALADTNHSGRALAKGELVTVSKSEARRLLTVRKNHFRIAQ